MATAGSSSSSPPSGSGLCIRCKEQPATLDLRTEPVCSICFAAFIHSKAIKRLEVLQRETRGQPTPSTTNPKTKPSSCSPPQRYLVALSLGPSSTALLRVLCENARRQKTRGGRGGVRPDLVVVHVDTSCVDGDPTSTTPSSEEPEAEDVLTPYRALFPEPAAYHVVRLSSVLRDPSLDWSALPADRCANGDDDDARLRALFARLPSPSARADVRRLLVRRALLAAAAERAATALLLGYSTTALAELTLAETAKGRGFGVPGAVNDGAVAVPTLNPPPEQGERIVHVYSPLRELFRKELCAYLRTSSPAPLLALLGPSFASPSAAPPASVVSHRDLSIDDVMARYFGEVEAAYPSVVANVVRTTGKLVLPEEEKGERGGEDKECGLCGMGLDVEGSARWRGEIGEVGEEGVGKLCYGCERSVRG
ncbi:hypothetical protein F4810DRAFT_532063 [Camillea tinctor]|nr:hypothetical protein F4810DRAFT_532063 [Camillea tinctor]